MRPYFRRTTKIKRYVIELIRSWGRRKGGLVTVIKHTINIDDFSNKANNCKHCRRVCCMGLFLCGRWGCLKVGRRGNGSAVENGMWGRKRFTNVTSCFLTGVVIAEEAAAHLSQAYMIDVYMSSLKRKPKQILTTTETDLPRASDNPVNQKLESQQGWFPSRKPLRGRQKEGLFGEP